MGMVILLQSDLHLLGMVKLTKVLNLAIGATQTSLLVIKEFVLLLPDPWQSSVMYSHSPAFPSNTSRINV